LLHCTFTSSAISVEHQASLLLVKVEAWVRAVFECALPTFAPSQAAAGSIMQLCNLALYIDDTPTYRNLSCGNLRVYNGKVVGPAKKDDIN
jgi:hypothetical protein